MHKVSDTKTLEEERAEVLNQAHLIGYYRKGQSVDEAEMNSDQAAAILISFMRSKGEFPDGLVAAGNYLLFGKHQYEDGVRRLSMSMIDKAVEMAPENIEILTQAVFDYYVFLSSDFPEKITDIIRITKTILKLDPNNVQAIVTLYATKHTEFSSTEWIRMLENAKAIAPDNRVVISDLGKAYRQAGQYGKAIEMFEHLKMKLDAEHDNSSFAKKQIEEIKALLADKKLI